MGYLSDHTLTFWEKAVNKFKDAYKENNSAMMKGATHLGGPAASELLRDYHHESLFFCPKTIQ
jgi:hypothetical protein